MRTRSLPALLQSRASLLQLLQLVLLLLLATPRETEARRRPTMKAPGGSSGKPGRATTRRNRAHARDMKVSAVAEADYDAALAFEEQFDYDAAEAAYAKAWEVAPQWEAPGVNRAVLLSKMRRLRGEAAAAAAASVRCGSHCLTNCWWPQRRWRSTRLYLSCTQATHWPSSTLPSASEPDEW